MIKLVTEWLVSSLKRIMILCSDSERQGRDTNRLYMPAEPKIIVHLSFSSGHSYLSTIARSISLGVFMNDLARLPSDEKQSLTDDSIHLFLFLVQLLLDESSLIVDSHCLRFYLNRNIHQGLVQITLSLFVDQSSRWDGILLRHDDKR